MVDVGQILRFATVGVCVAAFYVLGYSMLLSAGMSPLPANILAFVAAVIAQYVLQTSWTFRRSLGLPDQMLRFACTVAAGLAVSTLVTWAVGPALGWAPWVAAAVVAVLLPVQNYVIFRLWVYSAAG
ncbi:GtrA family protein [Nocardioides marinus]|jgi:putative flippase GtrA|uniref:GtrA family protein n=1 Tax=Leisingera sp. TaxID=1879318 RepID=UPI001C9791F1|nr:GtrA family protein [Nocardioides marinus]